LNFSILGCRLSLLHSAEHARRRILPRISEQPSVCGPIDAQKLIAEAKRGDGGALVVFAGIVRNQTRGRQTLYLEYEAYEEMALKQLDGLAREACRRFGVRQVTMVRRPILCNFRSKMTA
jgi:molybdopterin synthase catalytic subunit